MHMDHFFTAVSVKGFYIGRDTRKTMSVEAFEHKIITLSNQSKTKSIIFESGSLIKDDLTDHIHSLPCKIEYDGTAKVSQYFIVDTLENNEKVATFRGRPLNGIQQRIPEAYLLYVVVEKKNCGLLLVFSHMSRVFEVVGSAKSFMHWEYDRKHSHDSPLAHAFDYLTVAEAFSSIT
ncbi:unnamed protein product [Thelazia callipaeda]|uniref:ADF-H domain-containing protein n=1 Tax=Thelazia callipaeda TaxID=103827 RepID=A0A0N5D1J3_THECL|nr:unnamed protein product [Thelazia callipaeda]